MGIKRKASEFEQDNYPTASHYSRQNTCPPHDYHHNHNDRQTASRSSTPSQLSSSPSSTITNLSPHNSDLFNARQTTPIPFQPLRTRKRTRDNRPAQEVIHEQTLRKLYEAQRLHLDDTSHLPIDDDLSQASTLVDTSTDGTNYLWGVEMVDREGIMDVDMDVDMEIPKEVEPSQRRIDSFFGGKDGGVGR
jgi:hypothetical protein